MDANIIKAETAKQIRDRGYGNSQKSGINKLGAEDFFIKIRDAIISEYTQHGFCEMVDEYLYGAQRNIDVIVYAAIYQITSFRLYEKGSSPYVPTDPMVSQQSLTWENAQVGYVWDCTTINLIPLLSKANIAGHKLHLQYLQKNNMTDTVKKNQTEIEVENAKKEAMQIITDAKKERELIIADAKKEAGEIASFAKGKKDRETVRENSLVFMNKDDMQNADRLIEKYIVESQRAYKVSSERELSLIVDRNKDNLSKTEEFHDKMCEKTNELQVAWMNSISSSIDEMRELKEEFYKHLHEWQKGLYLHEYEQIAERYTELYRIIDVDRIIANEIVNLANMNGTSDNSRRKTRDGDSQNEIVEKLQKINESLSIFLRKFEVSLNGLGLYVYRVEEGILFNYEWHMNVDDTIDCEGKRIKRCVVPGIAKRAIGDGEDDVIIPALVAV